MDLLLPAPPSEHLTCISDSRSDAAFTDKAFPAAGAGASAGVYDRSLCSTAALQPDQPG